MNTNKREQVIRYHCCAIRAQHNIVHWAYQWTVSFDILRVDFNVHPLDVHCSIPSRNMCRVSHRWRSILLGSASVE